MSFPEFVRSRIGHVESCNSTEYVLALDPGETTGWAVFKSCELIASGQSLTKTLPQARQVFCELIDMYNPQVIVAEDYKVYGWKAQAHSWSSLHTPKIIGMLAGIAGGKDIPLHLQMAQQAKGFVTDVKLRSWGYYNTGKKHARDAIRHGCYFLVFKAGVTHELVGA